MGKIYTGLFLTVWLAAVNAGAGGGAEAAISPQALASLRAAGAVAYSHKPGYSATIQDVFLGYDAAGKPVAGVAVRQIKTYEKVTAMVLVRAQDGACVISQVIIPDLQVIGQQEKRDKVTGALNAFAGVVVRDAGGKTQAVDAVSGATRYQKQLYTYFNLMAGKLAEEMQQNPVWEKKPLPAESSNAAGN